MFDSTSATVAAADVSAENARFDAEVGAEVAPSSSVLLRSESASSSMIENLTSGAKSIALAELGSTEKRNATEIVGNVAAMRAALTLAGRLSEPPATEDRAVEVQMRLADLCQHRAPSIPNLLIAAAAELAGLTVLHIDKDFDLIATVTAQLVERLTT